MSKDNNLVDKNNNSDNSDINLKYNGLDESRVINQDYLHSLDDVYKCNICFKIMDNPTDCENCGHSFCYECIKQLKCPFGCQNKSLKPSSMAIKNILSNIKFKCLNPECKETILYSDVKRHDNICEFQTIICPNIGCEKRLLKKDLENHVKNECEFALVKCKYCDYKFDKKKIKNHEDNCCLVNKSLKNNEGDNSLDMSKIDTNEYLKLLSMNVSKIVKENQDLLNNNNLDNNININNELVKSNNTKNENEKKNNNIERKEFSQVNLRPSNFAQIDEDELLSLITSGVEEELKKYFLDFDRNFIKLSKDIQDIKEYFNQNNKNSNSNIKTNKYNMLIIDDNEEENNINNKRIKNDNIIENNYNEKDNNIFKKNLNLINTIKEAKESDEEDNESSKTFIKNVIEKTENGLKTSISELNNIILEQLKNVNIKLEENNKKNNNNILTNQQKLIIEKINNSIDRIIENINEFNLKISDLTNDFHIKIKELSNNKKNNEENVDNIKLFKDLKNSIISLIEKKYMDNFDNLSKLIDDKLQNNKIVNKEEKKEDINIKNEIINNNENETTKYHKEIENIQTQLSSIKNSVKQVINILKEEFADLSDLVNKKNEKKENPENIDSNNNNNINSNNVNNTSNSFNKLEKVLCLNNESLHKFSFSGDYPCLQDPKKNIIINSFIPNKSNTKINNKNQSPSNTNKVISQNNVDNTKNINNNELAFSSEKCKSFQSDDNNDINIKNNNDKIFNSILNLENRISNLENISKNLTTELKNDISNEFNKQVIIFNNKIENNLDNKINKMFSLKYCKECEKVDYFYGFIKCTICNAENCKQCIVLCLSCKHLLCKSCCNCSKCNKSYCVNCRILCTECNKKYCKNCLTNCSSCNKQLCLYCIRQCSNCKANNCDINCSKTCYICSKNVCNKCLQISNILNCSICNNNICNDCSIKCVSCNQISCKNCIKECYKCKSRICSKCYNECAQCMNKYCIKCLENYEKKNCTLCEKIVCIDCINQLSNCFLCSKYICKNCSSKCLCGDIYCNLCSLECEKCSRKCCNKCSSKCICEVAIYCNECIKESIDTVLMHDCLCFINDNSTFDKKKTRTKMSFSVNNNFEAKFYIINYNKCSKLLIGLTDNNNFEEDCEEDVNDIYVLNLIDGDKISTKNGKEKFMDIKLEKENIFVFIMIKDKKLFFKINEGEYKEAFDLIKEEYWIYCEKHMIENIENQIDSNNIINIDITGENYGSKIKFIFARKI